MKKYISGAAALLLLPLSVQAGEILPNLYARVYCESRAMGMADDQARRQAVSESYISTGNPMTVTINGIETTTDVVAAARTVIKRCPQYF